MPKSSSTSIFPIIIVISIIGIVRLDFKLGAQSNLPLTDQIFNLAAHFAHTLVCIAFLSFFAVEEALGVWAKGFAVRTAGEAGSTVWSKACADGGGYGGAVNAYCGTERGG